MVSIEVETQNSDNNMATVSEEKKEVKEQDIEEVKEEAIKEVKEQDIKEENDEAPSSIETKIIRQLEYYFGDVNMWRDKFLKMKVAEDDGWVTIECLTTFNRLKALSTDLEEIAKALRKSKNGLIEVHEDNTKMRRSPSHPLPDPEEPTLRKTSKMKRLYLKGFPTSYTLDDVQEFIIKQGCQPVFTKLKTDEEKNFKGSIIMEVTTLEEATKLLEDEIKCEDNVITVMRREEYFDKKNDKRRMEGKEDGEGVKDEKPAESQEPPKFGCVLHFKGAVNETSREDLKEVFGEHGEVEWVDFNRGDAQGYVRFKAEGGAQKAIDAIKAANDDKVVIKEAECEVKVIEGIEEKNYWILAMEERRRPKQRFQSNRGRRNKRSDRNQEWRKRRRPWEYSEKSERSENAPVNKHKKFDEEDNGGNKGDNSAKTKDNVESAEVKQEKAVET